MRTRIFLVLLLPVCLAAPISDIFMGDLGDDANHEHTGHEDVADHEHTGYEDKADHEHTGHEDKAHHEHTGHKDKAHHEHTSHDDVADHEHTGHEDKADYDHTGYEDKADHDHTGLKADHEHTGHENKAECSCSDFINKGYGQCKKGYSAWFGGTPFCYVKMPSNCADLVESQSNPGNWASAEACKRKSEIELNERLRLLFKIIDLDEDGLMDAKELIRFCQENNIDIPEAEAELIETISDNSVGLTVDNFVELLAECPSNKTEDIILFLMHAAANENRQGRILGFFNLWKTHFLDEVVETKERIFSFSADVDKGPVLSDGCWRIPGCLAVPWSFTWSPG